jgi:hypothetical protein
MRNSSSLGCCGPFPNGAAIRFGAAVFSFLLGLLILGQMPRVRQTGYLVMAVLSGS